MNTVYDEFLPLWPESSKAKLKPLLSRVMVLHFPRDRSRLASTDPRGVVLVVSRSPVSELIRLLRLGFRHIVQLQRYDLAQELLAASLMILKTRAFMNNPIPFFLSGFSTEEMLRDPDRHLILRFTRQTEKPTILDWLDMFLAHDQATNSVRDLCMQAADEMINNVLFNAPVQRNKSRVFKDLPRNSDIALPNTMGGKLFTCFADNRLVIGCADAYGSLNTEPVLDHLGNLFHETGNKFKTTGGGAGLGLRNMVENAANFYCLVEKGKFTIMACTYLLNGLTANLNHEKNLHIEIA